MSKKDKKRIAELERQQSILGASLRVMRKDLDWIWRSFEQDGRANRELLAGIIQSQKALEKTNQFCKCRGGVKCNNTRMPDPNLGEKEQEKTEQPQQTEAQKEQELADENRVNHINAALKPLVDDLAKHLNFTLENYGKDRAKQVEMLQAYCDHFKEDLSDFRRKVLSVSELVAAGQDEPKQDEKTVSEVVSELMKGRVWIIQTNPKKEGRLCAFYLEKVGADGVVLYTPDPNKAKQFNDFWDAKTEIFRIVMNSQLRYSLDDFNIMSAGAKQPETENQKYTYVILAGTEQDGTPLYVVKLSCVSAVFDSMKWIRVSSPYNIETTPNKNKAAQYENIETAQKQIADIKHLGAHKGCAFFVDLCPVRIEIEQKEDEQVEPILPAPEQKEAEQDGSELGGTDGADSPTRAGYYYIVIVNCKQGGAPLYLLDFEQTSCDGVPDMTIKSTSRKYNARGFNCIKKAQNFIDLAVECKADKGYSFFIDTVENSL